MDSQHLLTLLEELNRALEQQGMLKPDGQSRGERANSSIPFRNSQFVNMSKLSGVHAFWGIPCANSDYFFACSG